MSAPTPLGDPGPADGGTGTAATPPARARLRLAFHAVSDVGRVRKDNQDSGYAGPWLLAVCDGVGGAARGDIASSTAVNELRHLDEPPTPGGIDLLDRVSDGLQEAHVAIGAQVDADQSLNGTSTTATVALFDGGRLALAHVGDSRAYLLRDGELSQLTSDHTFVQSLIDEGRITEAEARVHPHRNLILKALDGIHDVEPDLFALELVPGDRLLLCSDGACGVLDDDALAALLAAGTPEECSTEMVRASLDAGSSDNVTCVVADVAEADAPDRAGTAAGPQPAQPAQIVGAAADPRQRRRPLFRGHRDTGELEPVTAEIPEGVDYAIPSDPLLDPEAARYAPRPPRRFAFARRVFALALVLGVLGMGLGAAYWWSQQQYYVGEDDGRVVVYRGVQVPGLSDVYRVSSLRLEDLSEVQRTRVSDGIEVDDLADAEETLASLGRSDADDDADPSAPIDPPATPAGSPAPSPSPSPSPAG